MTPDGSPQPQLLVASAQPGSRLEEALGRGVVGPDFVISQLRFKGLCLLQRERPSLGFGVSGTSTEILTSPGRS